jgi:hypothetical protein
MIRFLSHDPSVWDSESKGTKFAIPLQSAPNGFRSLRRRRIDTGEALILPLSFAELRNGKPPSAAGGSWTAKEEGDTSALLRRRLP